jgi:hypothetical protein
MRSRTAHALAACAIFLAIAKVYGMLFGQFVDGRLVLIWSVLGIGVYITLCSAFGFDPQRTKLSAFASPLAQYLERWELRLGQATLGMLGIVVVAARLVDPAHFVTAVVCGTLSAWTYFVLRLYRGGYDRS